MTFGRSDMILKRDLGFLGFKFFNRVPSLCVKLSSCLEILVAVVTVASGGYHRARVRVRVLSLFASIAARITFPFASPRCHFTLPSSRLVVVSWFVIIIVAVTCGGCHCAHVQVRVPSLFASPRCRFASLSSRLAVTSWSMTIFVVVDHHLGVKRW